MQGQSQQQAYDRGITIFSPDGRLYQVEYAREAVKRGTASVGIRAEDGVVLAADKRARSPLMEPESIEKLHKADDHVGVASFGVALIVGGIENGEPRLFETDPSGTPYEWQALSIGSDRSDLRDYLETEYEEGISTDEAVGLALDTLAQSNDGELSPDGVGVATITVDDPEYAERPVDEIESILDERDLLATDEDEADDGDADEE